MYKLILQIAFIFPISLLAQEYTLVTDRPDITESAVVVAKGILQAEHGFQFLSNNEKQTVASIPTLIRYCIGGKTEIRATIQSLVSINDNENLAGLLPISLGLKVELAKENGFIPQMALLTQLELAKVSSPALQENYTGLSAIWLGSYNIPGPMSFGCNIGIVFDGMSEQAIYPYSLSLGINLTQKLALFVEHYATISKSEFIKNADGGLTWLIHPQMQIDCSAGFSWESNNYFTGLGYSWFISTHNK